MEKEIKELKEKLDEIKADDKELVRLDKRIDCLINKYKQRNRILITSIAFITIAVLLSLVSLLGDRPDINTLSAIEIYLIGFSVCFLASCLSWFIYWAMGEHWIY